MSGGRPTMLTPELQQTIVEDVRTGVTPEIAARKAGVDRATYYRWMARGRKERSGPHRAFCDAVEGAVAEATALMEVSVVAGAARDPKYALEWLKRRQRPLWSEKADPSPPPEVEPVKRKATSDSLGALELRLEEIGRLKAKAEADGSWVAVKDLIKMEADILVQMEGIRTQREAEERARKARESTDIAAKAARVQELIRAAPETILVVVREALAEREGRTRAAATE